MVRVFGLVAALCFGLSGPAFAARLPIETWGHLPSVHDVSVSPDGSRIVLVVSTNEAQQVQIRKTADLSVERVFPIGTTKLRSVVWGDADHLIFVVSQTDTAEGVMGPAREWSMGLVYDLPRQKMRSLLQAGEDAMNVLWGTPVILTVNGHGMAFIKGITFVDGTGVLTLFRQDLASGITTTVVAGNAKTRDFIIDDQGKVVAREDYNETSGLWSLWTKPPSGAFLKPSLSLKAPLDSPNLLGFDTDKSTLIVSLSDDKQERVFRRIALGGDHWLDTPETDVDGGRLEDRRSRTTLGYVHQSLTTVDYHFTDPADQKTWAAIVKAFPHDAVWLSSWSNDRKIVILQVEGESGAAFFLLNMATKHADWLADEYQDLHPDKIAPVKAIHYQAADGLSIPAYLTLPRDAAPDAKLPLVVLVHGGPAARDDLGFDWWSQALASRGYAVLQPQYRGSEGYGDAFMAAGYGEWGHKMQSDVSDGVRHLAAEGRIDPSRVCIVGASYGGYAALAGVTLEKDVYRCAVSVAGIADLGQFLDWEADRHDSKSETFRYWKRFTGAASTKDPRLEPISPIKHIDNVKVPILLIHGTDDTVVPIRQSRIMADALAKTGHPAKLVTLTKEDHWLSRSQTRTEMLRAVEGFLGENLPVGQ